MHKIRKRISEKFRKYCHITRMRTKNLTYKKGIPLFHPRGNGLKSATEREKRFETVRTHLLFFAVLSLFVMFVPCPSSALFGIPCPPVRNDPRMDRIS